MTTWERFATNCVALLLGGLTGFGVGCTAPSGGLMSSDLLAGSFLSDRSGGAVDQDKWWKENQRRAQFVPGKGYAVEGVDGFFDQQGRRIGQPIQNASHQAPSQPTPNHSLISSRDAGSAERPQNAIYARLEKAIGQGPDEAKARELFAEGKDLYLKREFAPAADKFKDAAKRWPDSPLEEDSLFMLAESKFFSDDYPAANDAYNEILKKYSGSRRLNEIVVRQFAIAHYWHQHHNAKPRWPVTPNMMDKTRHIFDTFGHALKAYESIRLNDPTGPLADDALMATASAHFTRGRYEDADYHYGLLRREYPKSEHQFQSHLLGLQCKLRMYQGAEYDGSVLEEADKLVEQLLTQFPDKLGRERERVIQMRAELAAQRALREWEIAEYYAKGKHYGAARFHYERLVEKYPQSKLAQQAKVRLADYQDRPSNPAQLDWLVNLFPESQRSSAVASRPMGSGMRR